MRKHYISPYNWYIYIAVCAEDVKKLRKALRKDYGDDDGVVDDLVESAAHGTVIMHSSLNRAVVLINTDKMANSDCSLEYIHSVAVHESVHVGVQLADAIGYNPIKSGDDEPFAYLIGDISYEIICEINQFIQNNNLIIRRAR